jgi:hypothetical protein
MTGLNPSLHLCSLLLPSVLLPITPIRIALAKMAFARSAKTLAIAAGLVSIIAISAVVIVVPWSANHEHPLRYRLAQMEGDSAGQEDCQAALRLQPMQPAQGVILYLPAARDDDA